MSIKEQDDTLMWEEQPQTHRGGSDKWDMTPEILTK